MSPVLELHYFRPPNQFTTSLFTCNSKSQASNSNYHHYYVTFNNKSSLQSSLQQVNTSVVRLDHVPQRISLSQKIKKDNGNLFDALPYVRRLSEFQTDELKGTLVLVRFDSNVLHGEKHDQGAKTFVTTLSTIKYLHQSGAKVILMSSWSAKTNSTNTVSAYLSSILKLKVVPMKCFVGYEQLKMDSSSTSSIFLLENLSLYKEDVANGSTFSEKLCSGVDIFINDAFFQSHKTLASTVGVTSFCNVSIAGFLFEQGLIQLKKAFGTKTSPCFAMVGGGNLVEKAGAVRYLVSVVDGLILVGNMAFQIMHALGLPVPKKLVEAGAVKEAFRIIQLAKYRNISILFPKDFWCLNNHIKEQELELVPAHSILEGWSPVALGPNSLDEITTFLSMSKKIVWIGPVKFGSSTHDSHGTSTLAKLVGKLSEENCDVTVVGNTACEALTGETLTSSSCNIIESAAVVWDFLKGRNLPGLMALDRGYPYSIDWHAIYADPSQPLLVDIGSGNGLFLFGMASKRKDMNFLGLEMNGKLVKRCLETLHQSGIKNGYFIETNATSTFHSIVSGYPGELVFASIQCPNPDFNRSEHRWKMVQSSLIEAISDLLSSNGKVFLQSDIEDVALRMKQQFLKYGNRKFVVDHQHEWLTENPFGVESDWERHVLQRGLPMYRLMLSKLMK